MDPPRTIIIGISGCSSSGKTTLARLLRDMFPETFILHEDDFYKPESQLPIKDGFADWDCPEAISIPDLEAALAHVRATGTFPVSDAPYHHLSHRSSHGCITAPFLPPVSATATAPILTSPSVTPSAPSSSPLSPERTSPARLTRPANPRRPQPNLNSLEDLNSVGPCPASPEQIAACAAKVREWLSPGLPGSLIFGDQPSPSSAPSPSSSADAAKQPKTRICILDGFLLYAPTTTDSSTTTTTTTPTVSSPLRGVTTQLDIKLFLQASRERAVARRGARDGYVHVEGFWTDPPGYVERVVWPNYVEAHRWLFEGGDVDGATGGRLDRAVLQRERILSPALDLGVNGGGESGGEGNQDIEFGKILEWAVDVVMRELERLCLGEKDKDGIKKEE
ncbi:hypothetical protein VTH82DRAFT_98 [Thermothelomyces myriococcoides]